MLFYYEPEKPTINYLFQPLIDYYLEEGFTVNIVTPNPTRGLGKDEVEKYLNSTIERRQNLFIHRVKSFTYLPEKFSKWNLFKRYVSVSLNLSRYLKKLNSDIIFVSSNPPLLYSYRVTKFAAQKKIPVIYNVQDIYPNNIFKKRNPFYFLFNFLQKKSLKRATEIVTISQTMRDTLLKKGKYADKLNVIYNFDISNVKMYPAKANPFFNANKFNVVYAGNIGYVQDVDVILAAAKELLNNPYIAFHIFGEGSQASRIHERIKAENIVNTTFYAPLKVKESALLYKTADVNLISIRPGIIDTALPLKTASCLAAKKPIIFIGLDSKHELWSEHPGITKVNNRDYVYLSKKILTLANKEKELYNFSTHLFSKETYLKDYITIMNRYLKAK